MQRGDRQADAVDRDAGADGQPLAEAARELQPEAAQARPVGGRGHLGHALDDAGEHGADYPARRRASTGAMDTAAPDFRLTDPPPGFIDDPYPVYAALREQAPVHALAPGSWLLTRYADVAAVYRSADVSSDKQREFGPKLGVGTPIYEHHTTSLVFSDPPLHTRVRRLLMGALNQRAIARMEPGLVALVDGLLDAPGRRSRRPT